MMIRTPPPVSLGIVQTPAGCASGRLEWNPGAIAIRNNNFTRSQKFIDSEVLRLSAPYIPLRTGTLIRSGTLSTIIGSGTVKWATPYARKQYYENKGKGKRGRLWFERMKAACKRMILQGVAKLTGGNK